MSQNHNWMWPGMYYPPPPPPQQQQQQQLDRRSRRPNPFQRSNSNREVNVVNMSQLMEIVKSCSEAALSIEGDGPSAPELRLAMLSRILGNDKIKMESSVRDSIESLTHMPPPNEGGPQGQQGQQGQPIVQGQQVQQIVQGAENRGQHTSYNIMSGDGSNSSNFGNKKGFPLNGPNDEDSDNDRLWSDFENCAQSVTRLYSNSSWESLQTAAASTTQLYKTSVASHKKGFERGVQAGRASLAKEVLAAMSGAKADLRPLLDLLYHNIGRCAEDQQRGTQSTVVSQETVAAVHLFQQALTLAPSITNSELDVFLNNQVQRHRKRQRSPSSPNSIFKKMRKQ